jgi:hypothetical protein
LDVEAGIDINDEYITKRVFVYDRSNKIKKSIKRKPYKGSKLKRFLTYFDCIGTPAEFGVRQQYKSSLLSIIVTYSWIIGAIIC